MSVKLPRGGSTARAFICPRIKQRPGHEVRASGSRACVLPNDYRVEQARKAARKSELPTSTASLVRRASDAPFGPCWVSESLERGDEGMPALITVVVTRVLTGGLLLPHVILVDRTCLGVKNAMVAQPMDEDTLLSTLIQRPEMPMSPCELLVAQSVVYHAIDYARSLGFEPHRDFHPALLGKRPERGDTCGS